MRPFDVIAAPLAPGTCALIEANAGTGKTFNIQHLYLRLLLEQELEPAQILVVTFTEAATAELRDRIRQNLAAALACLDNGTSGDQLLPQLMAQARHLGKSDDALRAALSLALAAFDEASIFTIHGFCNRTLTSQAFDSGVAFDCELCTSYAELIRETVADFYRQELSAAQPPDASFEALLQHARTALGHLSPLVFEPADTDPNALWVNLVNAARNTPIPQRKSDFKDCFTEIKEAVAANNLRPDSPLLQNPSLNTSTAANNAPVFIKALTRFRELPLVVAYERLRTFLAHDQHGFEARKRRQQTMGYDDLLKRMAAALTGPECRLACELRKNYRVALVDEFQDTDPVQYKIFETVFKHPASMLFMIGDPKQAIYGFRGGDIYAYLEAKQKVAQDSCFTLSKNYRSSKELIMAVNHLFAPPGAFAEEGLDYHDSAVGREPHRRLLRKGAPEAEPFQTVWFTGDADGKAVSKSNLRPKIIRHCAAQISELLTGNAYIFANADGDSAVPVHPGDIAVLVTTNSEAEAVQKRVQKLNIPAVIYKAGNVFASEDAKNLWYVLSAMLAPGKAGPLKAALLTPWCAYGPQDIIDLEAVSAEFERHVTDFAELRTRWVNMGVMSALTAFLDKYSGLTKIASDPACERRLTNFRHLAELLHQAESASELAPEALLQWFRAKLTDPDQDDETYEQRMESDRKAVTIMTIHKSKGLQFPVVFIPFMLTRDIKPGDKRVWTVHRDDGQNGKQVVLPVVKSAQADLASQRMTENMAEDLRLLYVAVTRAENFCSLLLGNVAKQAASSAVNFLGQKHANHTLTPISFIEKKDKDKEAGPTSPFVHAPHTATTALDLTELGALQTVPYAPLEKPAALAPPPAPPLPPDDWAVMSYSALTQHAHSAPAHIKPDAGTDEVSDGATPSARIDTLPGGIATGLCVHAIFENLALRNVTPAWQPSDAEIALVDAQAARFGLYAADALHAPERRGRLLEMISTTLNRTLPDGETGFSLSEIPDSDTRREWEFFFHMPGKMHLTALQRLGLTFKEGGDRCSGFMTGSIDLLFRRSKRYYFADWKTDTLGDYSPDTLRQVMVERNYLFQAIVYAVALHSLLKQTLGSDYVFERNFGGGYYCFVRGMGHDTGVFRYQPDLAELERWSALLRSRT